MRRALGVVTAAVLLAGFAGAGGSAASAKPVGLTRPADSTMVITQPDRAKFRAVLTAPQLGGRLEVDGYTILKGADSWWRYATRDRGGRLVATGVIVGRGKPPAGVAPGVGRVKKTAAALAADPRLALAGQLKRALNQATAKKAASGRTAAAGGGPTIFKFPVLMLATWWDQAKGQTGPQFQPGSDTPAYFKAILDGFGGNPKGSLTEYYFENSYGQFLVQVDVFGPFKSTLSSLEGPCYYGGIDPPDDPLGDLDPLDTVLGAGGGGAAGMTVEAVPAADSAVNFADYDNDGDGYVDFMGIVHSGADMAVTGDECNTWSHALPLSSIGDIAEGILGLPTDTFRGGLPTLDGVLIDRVFTMPEFDEPGGGLNIGVASHEMAHALGEPDYYAVNQSSSGDGDWDIMSGGSYLGNPGGSNPSWFNPATRVFQGWVTPTIVHGDLKNYTLAPRETPMPGYGVGKANPNLLLVPNRWIKVGDTDADGHTWTQNDVYGLANDGVKGYVIEGWYLEYVSRVTESSGALHAGMTRSPYFDRGDHGSGLLTWHFDYWRRSNVYFGANNAQDDPNRMQMDVEEWDFNDNTQDIALDIHRGESSDPVHPTATGITSGTHAPSPNSAPVAGTPQAPIDVSGGPTLPVASTEDTFTVDANPANTTMRVRVAGVGDCIMQLFRVVNGQRIPASDAVDSGGAGEAEEVTISKPAAGGWVVEVSDFAACLNWSGTVTFGSPSAFDSTGTADTWSNATEAATGWAFTNVRTPGQSDGLDLGSESGAGNRLTLDVVKLDHAVDVSAGYVWPAVNDAKGRGVVTAGKANPMVARVFSNGGTAPGNVTVTVREGSATGKVISQQVVPFGAYQGKDVAFAYTPAKEGPYTLYTTVSAGNDAEPNNAQATTGWAGPPNPTVLVVDDEGYTDGEKAYTGALAALGVPYAVATTHVSAATMKAYSAVIWVGAIDRKAGQLNEDDRAAIASYLNGGGKFWLASNRAAGAAGVDDAAGFITQYFGATVEDTPTIEQPHIATGTGAVFPAALSFELQPYPIRPFSDVIAAASSGVFGTAKLALKVTKTNRPGLDGKGFGTQVTGDSAHGSFRSVLTPFSLSQASSADTWVAVTRAVLDSFGLHGGQYTPKTTDPLVFHSALRFQVSGRDTPVTAIVVGGAAGQPVALSYRIHGAKSFASVAMKPGTQPGVFAAAIPKSAVTPSGVDYFLKAGAHSTYDPAAAVAGLTHAIAVGVPEVAAAAPAPAAEPPVSPLPATGGDEPLLLIAALLVAALSARRAKPV